MRYVLILVAFIVPLSFVIAGNILPSNSVATLQIDETNVEFDCSGCDVEVTDTEVLGLIWGGSLGWVNLQPSDGGVFNTRTGVVSGNAWGSVSGWINFTGVFIDPYTGEFSGEAFSQNRGPIIFECPGASCVITSWRPYGCTNPSAGNYDSTATVDDGSCQVIIDPDSFGCTDPEANNYNPYVTTDDGSCTYDVDPGPDPDPEDNTPVDPVGPGGGGGGGDDIQDVLGCIDPEANNYNQYATTDNGSCLYGVDIAGCMDSSSPLYNPNATVSNPDACVVESYGCMDPGALNFDSNATINDQSCIYSGTEGCTDFTAINYNPNTLIDDGSCVFDTPGHGCTDPSALNYNPSATFDNGTCLFQIGGEENNGENGDNNQNNGEDITVNPILIDTDNNNIPDVLQGGEELLTGFFDQSPGIFGDTGKALTKYIAEQSPMAKAIAIAILLASILQTIPFREGNFLFSIFSTYKTRKHWGTVYDAVTKQPLDPAYVTLFDEAGQAIDTSITDIDGRYNFTVGPGKYFISAQKTDYQFPSVRLKDKKYDELYSHLYFGGEVVIEKEDDVISRNIPMDPLRFNWNEYAKQKTKVTHFYKSWHRTLNGVAKILFFFGFIFAIWVFVVSPTIFAFIIVSLYVITTVLKLLGIFKTIPKGYVKDRNGFAVPFAIIRVYSETLNREVKHTIVGPKGHYLLLVPNGHYHMTVEQKLPDGTYREIHKTSPFKVRRGYIAKKITVSQVIVSSEEENFNTMFTQKPA